ncbi:MAG: flagellar hook-basal body protein [Desulfobacteraceae bacterium]
MLLEVTRPVQGGLRQEKKLDVVSNHIANANTAGFKRDVVSFDKEFKARMNTDFSQGPLRKTGNKLDVALNDEGFFKVDTQAGIRYTRNGNFTLDSNGILVDKQGNPVLGQGGAMILEGGDVNINERGGIFIDGEYVDALDIVTFENLEGIKKEGADNFIYEGNTQDEIPPAQVSVEQGALEGSGVKVVEEMVRMIDNHRMYETFSKSITTFDEVDGKAINDVGQLR